MNLFYILKAFFIPIWWSFTGFGDSFILLLFEVKEVTTWFGGSAFLLLREVSRTKILDFLPDESDVLQFFEAVEEDVLRWGPWYKQVVVPIYLHLLLLPLPPPFRGFDLHFRSNVVGLFNINLVVAEVTVEEWAKKGN